MRAFYVIEAKKYLIIGSLAACLITLLLRVLIPQFSIYELQFHKSIRTLLGHPPLFYSTYTLIGLSILYQIIYSIIGAIIAIVIFKLLNRQQGYTLLFTTTLKRIFSIGLIFLVFLFLRIDTLNALQFSAQIPSISGLIPNPVKNTISYFFLPSILSLSNKNYHPLQNTQTPAKPFKKPNPIYTAPQTAPNTQSNTSRSQPVPVRMATPQELFSVLNSHRQQNGKAPLTWDAKLANFAQSRANTFNSLGRTDGHAGFNNYLQNGAHRELDFYGLGENSSYGEAGDATHLITVFYGQSGAHNNNQLKDSWTHVGIGVSGTGTDFIFGGKRMSETAHP